METGKKVQDSSKKNASGFCAVRNRNGNWIGYTVGKKTFHPCKEILEDIIAKDNIVMMDSKSTSYVLDEDKVQIEGSTKNKAYEGLTQHQIDLINHAHQPHFERERI